MDYSRFVSSNRYYPGAERKKGIVINGIPHIVKYQKNSPEGLKFNHVSEYIGSHIFEILEINVQKTSLGTCDGKNVVVMEDFLGEDEIFVPFNGVGDSSLERDKERYQYTYDDIMCMLNDNIKLTDVEETIDRFWDIYIVDALTGNFDRHGSNWGFIKKNNQYRMAPVFDNGSCLFPSLNTDEKILQVLNDEEEINKRIYEFPTSQIKIQNKKSSYFEIISKLQFTECNKSLIRIVEKIDINKIYELINNLDMISDLRKEFYCIMLGHRYEKILLESYNDLIKEKGKNL